MTSHSEQRSGCVVVFQRPRRELQCAHVCCSVVEQGVLAARWNGYRAAWCEAVARGVARRIMLQQRSATSQDGRKRRRGKQGKSAGK
jgi:hypothetical protein